jgi:uncharacterized protein DUF1569
MLMDFYLSRVKQAIEGATSGMTWEQMSQHAPGKWSAAEILEHLNLTYSGTTRAMEKCLEAGSLRLKPVGVREHVAKFVVVNFKWMPTGRQSPAYAIPSGAPPEQVCHEIHSNLAKMDEVISNCELRFGKQTKLLNHVFLGPLTAQQWRVFHWVHAKHHMKQVESMRARVPKPQE